MEAGTVLASKYRLDSELGRGGMGSVWRALHLGLNAPVAIKLMDPAIMKTPGMLVRFHREAQAAAQLRSPHVVQIIDHGVDPETETPFIAMELLEGESLADRLTRLGVLSPIQTSRIVTEVCRALARAHEAGIVHRDLKPANLFLVENGDQELTKVLDFGIAKSQPTEGIDTMTHSGSILGTPLYMSPEQIRGGRAVDARSDLWSLAVVACECLTGKRPFSADSIGALTLVICTEPVPRPSSLAPVPAGFDLWFERAVMREPSMRFQTAREFAEELRRVCGASSEESAWSMPPDRPPPWLRRPTAEAAADPATPPQFGSPRPPAGPDGLPLAPTVDMKGAHTGDALATSSHDQKRQSRAPSRAKSALAVLALGAVLAGLLALGSAVSNRELPLQTSSESALPGADAPQTPVAAAAPDEARAAEATPLPRVPPAASPVASSAALLPNSPAPSAGKPASGSVRTGLHVKRASSANVAAPPASAAPSPTPSASAARPEITLDSVIRERR